MRSYFLLVKAVFATTMNARRNPKTKKLKKGTYLPQIISSIIITVVFALSFYMNFSSYAALDLSLTDLSHYLIPSLAFTILYAFFFSLTLTFNVFFFSDNSSFLPLPISGFKLLSARFLLHLFNTFTYGAGLIFADIIMIPVILGLGPLSIVYAVLISFLLLFSIAFASFIVSCLLARLIDLKSHSNLYTIISVVLSLIGAACLLGSTTFAPDIEVEMLPSLDLAPIRESLNSYYSATSFCNFLGYLPFRGVVLETTSDHLSLLYLFLILIALIGIAFLVSNFMYIKTLTINKGRKRKKQKEERVIKDFSKLNRGKTFIYLKREIGIWKRSPSVLVLSLFSTLSAAVTLLVSGIIVSDSLRSVADNPATATLAYMMIHIFLMESIFNPFSGYASISLEGRSFLLLKTLPIDKNRYLLAKIFPSASFSTLLCVLFSIIASAVLRLPASYAAIIFFSALACSLTNSFLSLLFGTIFAKFNYDNATEITNRGIGPFLVSILSFLSPFVSIILDVIFYFYIPQLLWLGILVGAIFYSIVVVALFFLTKRQINILFTKDVNIS